MFSSSTKSALDQHLTSCHESSSKFTCITCHSALKENEVCQNQRCQPICSFSCDFCDFSADQIDIFLGHVNNYHREGYFPRQASPALNSCNWCHFTVNSKSVLHEHIHNSHSLEMCTFCDILNSHNNSLDNQNDLT